MLGQTYVNKELVMVDGGSTDGALEPDASFYDAMNKGFAKTTGEIMGWICGGVGCTVSVASIFCWDDCFIEYSTGAKENCIASTFHGCRSGAPVT